MKNKLLLGALIFAMLSIITSAQARIFDINISSLPHQESRTESISTSNESLPDTFSITYDRYLFGDTTNFTLENETIFYFNVNISINDSVSDGDYPSRIFLNSSRGKTAEIIYQFHIKTGKPKTNVSVNLHYDETIGRWVLDITSLPGELTGAQQNQQPTIQVVSLQDVGRLVNDSQQSVINQQGNDIQRLGDEIDALNNQTAMLKQNSVGKWSFRIVVVLFAILASAMIYSFANNLSANKIKIVGGG